MYILTYYAIVLQETAVMEMKNRFQCLPIVHTCLLVSIMCLFFICVVVFVIFCTNNKFSLYMLTVFGVVMLHYGSLCDCIVFIGIIGSTQVNGPSAQHNNSGQRNQQGIIKLMLLKILLYINMNVDSLCVCYV